MSEFKAYKRTGAIEARPWEETDGDLGELQTKGVSVSAADIGNGSPKSGDMIARNPLDHSDMWLIAKKFFADNYVSE